jgi:hypothetical protein
MTNTDPFRVRVLQFLDRLKDGITVQRENLPITHMFDPSADYDLYARQINNNIMIMIYSKHARCIIRVYVDKNGEWNLRSISCRR